MDSYAKLVKPASRADHLEDLEDAYQKGEHWLGYMWGPTRTSTTLDLVVLEEEECLPGCDPAEGYAYPPYEVLIWISADLPTRAPDFVEMLRKYHLPTVEQVAIEGWLRDNSTSETEAAINWLSTSKHWHGWVTLQARNYVEAALDDEKTISHAD